MTKKRYKKWKDEIPPNTISWNTFKKLTNEFGMEEGTKKAQLILKRKDNESK